MAKKNVATFLGTQKGLSIVGNYCYAYSGVVRANGSDTTALDFHTGDSTIVGVMLSYCKR